MTSLSTSYRKLSRKEKNVATISGGIGRQQFKPGSRNFTHLSGAIGHTEVPDITSLVASGRLQNAIKYCTQVRKTGPAGERVVGHCLT